MCSNVSPAMHKTFLVTFFCYFYTCQQMLIYYELYMNFLQLFLITANFLNGNPQITWNHHHHHNHNHQKLVKPHQTISYWIYFIVKLPSYTKKSSSQTKPESDKKETKKISFVQIKNQLFQFQKTNVLQ